MPTNIDNAIINGIPQATTTEELRNWLLSRNLPNVITEAGFQQNIEMFQESSLLFEEDNNNVMQQLIAANEYYNPGLFYDNGILNSGQAAFNMYGQTNLGELNIDTVTTPGGSQMPHIECDFPEHIIPVQSSSLCEINLYNFQAIYTADNGVGADLYEATTSQGGTVGDLVQPGRFGKLPRFMLGSFDNSYTVNANYPSPEIPDIITLTQSQNPANNPYSWFLSNPVMYDLFISPNFNGNFMRFDATMTELSPLDNRFYGLKINERGFQFNNASAPDGSGVKTFYTPLQPYNDGLTDSAPSILIQNTRILEQYILGSFGTRFTRDAQLLRNLYSSGDMYIGGTPDNPAIDFIEGTVGLNNPYFSLAWALSGPRKPKSNTNYFVQQLRISDIIGAYTEQEFGTSRNLREEIKDNRKVKSESAARWTPHSEEQFIVESMQGINPGTKGLLSFTQRLVDTSITNPSEVAIGDSIRQDTKYIRTRTGTLSRGSGIANYKKDGQQPYARSWVRPSNIHSPESGNETPESYSRYDALVRHRSLVRGTTGDTFGTRGGWSNGGSVINDVSGAHIAQSSKDDTRNFMFSLENLAWKDNVEGRLAKHEIGPNGGRLMWFPPYIESWTENTNANYNQTDIIGRIEPIWTYKNSVRQANLNFIMVTDYPEVIDTMDFTSNSDMEAAQFFGGQDFNRHLEKIVAGKPPTFSNPEEYYGLLAQVVAPQPVNRTQIPEGYQVPNDTGPADSKPLQVFYFSGCSEIGSVVYDTTNSNPDEVYNADSPLDTNAGQFFQQQFEAIQGSTIDPFRNTDDEIQHGAELEFENLGKFLATDAGKQYRIVITTYGAPIYELQAENQIINDIMDSMDPSQGSMPVQYYSDQSDEAQEIFAQDKTTCAPLRGNDLQTRLQNKILYYEKGSPGAVTGTSETNLEDWYSDQDPPEGRWEFRDGGRVPGVGQTLRNPSLVIVEDTVLEPGIVEIGSPLPVVPVTISIEPNPELLSNTAFEDSEAEYVQELTETHNNYVQNNVRIPDGDYFEKLKETDLFAYQTYKDQVKNFHPTFHAIHPCGFNSRMTFLNQCMRPGPSLNGMVGPNNMAFGRPPICVLRLGDFYHCKVVINNIDFSYEQPFWDLNPEGIGAQPWLVRVSMQFFIVGGMSLAGPLSQLQNAISFNYFANTELCEPDRANPNKYNTTVTTQEEITEEEITVTNITPTNSGSTFNDDYSGDSGGGGGYDYSGDSGDYDYSGDSGGTEDNENNQEVQEYTFQDAVVASTQFVNIWDLTNFLDDYIPNCNPETAAAAYCVVWTHTTASLGRVTDAGVTPAVFKLSYQFQTKSVTVNEKARQLGDSQTHNLPLITDTTGCIDGLGYNTIQTMSVSPGCQELMTAVVTMNEQIRDHYIETFDKYKKATPSGYWNNPTAYNDPPENYAYVATWTCSESNGDLYNDDSFQYCASLTGGDDGTNTFSPGWMGQYSTAFGLDTTP